MLERCCHCAQIFVCNIRRARATSINYSECVNRSSNKQRKRNKAKINNNKYLIKGKKKRKTQRNDWWGIQRIVHWLDWWLFMPPQENEQIASIWVNGIPMNNICLKIHTKNNTRRLSYMDSAVRQPASPTQLYIPSHVAVTACHIACHIDDRVTDVNTSTSTSDCGIQCQT